MAPIIITNPCEDDRNLDGPSVSKEKLLNLHCANASSGVVVWNADGEGGDAPLLPLLVDPEPGDGDPLDQADETEFGRRHSSLFVDENEVIGSLDQFSGIRTSHLGNDETIDAPIPLPDEFTIPSLSLMPSSSPTSSSSPKSSSSPSNLGRLDDAEIGTQPFFDESKWIQSQIDADEELARQLQEEENKIRPNPKPKGKPKVVPSLADSLFGEPLTWEVRGNYTKVQDCSNSGHFVPDSISSGMSMLTYSFKKWGDKITSAANDFFAEDVGMQIKNPRARISGGQDRHAV